MLHCTHTNKARRLHMGWLCRFYIRETLWMLDMHAVHARGAQCKRASIHERCTVTMQTALQEALQGEEPKHNSKQKGVLHSSQYCFKHSSCFRSFSSIRHFQQTQFFMCMQQLAGSTCMQQPSAAYTCRGWFTTARPCTCEEVAPDRGPAAIGGVLGMDGGLAAAARVLGLGAAPRRGLCLLVAWTNCLPTHHPRLSYVAANRSLHHSPA